MSMDTPPPRRAGATGFPLRDVTRAADQSDNTRHSTAASDRSSASAAAKPTNHHRSPPQLSAAQTIPGVAATMSTLIAMPPAAAGLPHLAPYSTASTTAYAMQSPMMMLDASAGCPSFDQPAYLGGPSGGGQSPPLAPSSYNVLHAAAFAAAAAAAMAAVGSMRSTQPQVEYGGVATAGSQHFYGAPTVGGSPVQPTPSYGTYGSGPQNSERIYPSSTVHDGSLAMTQPSGAGMPTLSGSDATQGSAAVAPLRPRRRQHDPYAANVMPSGSTEDLTCMYMSDSSRGVSPTSPMPPSSTSFATTHMQPACPASAPWSSQQPPSALRSTSPLMLSAPHISSPACSATAPSGGHRSPLATSPPKHEAFPPSKPLTAAVETTSSGTPSRATTAPSISAAAANSAASSAGGGGQSPVVIKKVYLNGRPVPSLVSSGPSTPAKATEDADHATPVRRTTTSEAVLASTSGGRRSSPIPGAGESFASASSQSQEFATAEAAQTAAQVAASAQRASATAAFHAALSAEPLTAAEVTFRRRTEVLGLPTFLTTTPIGTYVFVEGDWGVDLGRLTSVSAAAPEATTGGRKLHRVIRVATAMEVARIWPSLEADEDHVLQVARRRAAETLISTPPTGFHIRAVEYQADRKKLFVYYTAKERVYFVPLLRSLNSTYRCRIWMEEAEPLSLSLPAYPPADGERHPATRGLAADAPQRHDEHAISVPSLHGTLDVGDEDAAPTQRVAAAAPEASCLPHRGAAWLPDDLAELSAALSAMAAALDDEPSNRSRGGGRPPRRGGSASTSAAGSGTSF